MLQSRFRGELVEACAKHAVEGREGMNDVGERLQWRSQLDRELELAHDLARTWSDQGRADQHSVAAVGNQLQHTAAEVVDVASRRLAGIGRGDDDINAARARGYSPASIRRRARLR